MTDHAIHQGCVSMRRKAPLVLAVLTITATIAAVIATTRAPDGGRPVDGVGARLGPSLDAINDARRVEIIGGGHSVTLIRAEAGSEAGAGAGTPTAGAALVWRVGDRDGYPAATDKVKALVVGLAETRTEEPRTTRPELYARLGVEGPSVEASGASTEVRIIGADDKPLADIILGKPAMTAPGTKGALFHARRAGEERAWLVRGPVAQATADPVAWLDPTTPRIARDAVKTVTITDPDGAAVTLTKGGAAGRALVAPDDFGPIDALMVERLAGAMAFLSFDDVRRATPDEFAGAPTITFTADGGRAVTTRVITRDDQRWIALATANWPNAPDTGGWAYRIDQTAAGDFPPSVAAIRAPADKPVGD